MAKTIVAERMKTLREGIHLSQAKLAAKLGVDQPAVFRYENGLTFPSYAVLMRNWSICLWINYTLYKAKKIRDCLV